MKNFVSYYYKIKLISTGQIVDFIKDAVIKYPLKDESDINHFKNTIKDMLFVSARGDIEIITVSIITWRPLDE